MTIQSSSFDNPTLRKYAQNMSMSELKIVRRQCIECSDVGNLQIVEDEISRRGTFPAYVVVKRVDNDSKQT